jgi:hypothetical protein
MVVDPEALSVQVPEVIDVDVVFDEELPVGGQLEAVTGNFDQSIGLEASDASREVAEPFR